MHSQDSQILSHNTVEDSVLEHIPFVLELGSQYYSTSKGVAILGDSKIVMGKIPDNSIDLIFTSPPFALRRKKKYGNEPPEKYIDWFMSFGEEFKRILKDTGSLVIDIGSSWNPGQPTKSLYHHKLLISLIERLGFYLAQEVFWYNPAKLPSPAQWVCIERCRLKDSVNWIWWLSKTPKPKASNRRVLTPYKPNQKALIEGVSYNKGRRPSEHRISDKFNIDNGGAIPPNMIMMEDNLICSANTISNDPYLTGCKKLGITPHPARIPAKIPDFFIRFLTEPGDIILDPFSGSNVTGFTAEKLERYWVAIEKDETYMLGSKCRFNL